MGLFTSQMAHTIPAHCVGMFSSLLFLSHSFSSLILPLLPHAFSYIVGNGKVHIRDYYVSTFFFLFLPCSLFILLALLPSPLLSPLDTPISIIAIYLSLMFSNISLLHSNHVGGHSLARNRQRTFLSAALLRNMLLPFWAAHKILLPCARCAGVHSRKIRNHRDDRYSHSPTCNFIRGRIRFCFTSFKSC